MFMGNMNAIRYGKIVEAGLVHFVRIIFPDGHQLQQNNDPKHRNNYIEVSKFHDIYWWKSQRNLLILTLWGTVGVP